MKPENLESVYGLSPTQEGMLFHSLYEPGANVYFLQIALSVRGDLDASLVRRAWEQVVARHPVLRTAIHWQGLEKPVQVVHRKVALPWSEEDWRALPEGERDERWRELLRADRERGFDLSRAPLLRLTLIRAAEDLSYFVWSFHHILIDGWCLPILLQEVFACYVALRRGEVARLPPVRPYRDYIAWLQRQDPAASEAFWRRYLEGFSEPPTLGAGRPAGPSGGPLKHGESELAVPAPLTAALTALARQYRLTSNSLLQGAWALLLGRYGNSADVVFGSTFSGRSAPLPGIESMVGLFINTLPVRIELPEEARLASWLEGLWERQAELLQREYTPLVDIQRWSAVPPGVPLFESLLVFENYPVGEEAGQLAGDVPFAVEVESQFTQNNYPLALVAFAGERLVLRLKYEARRFDEDVAVRMLSHLEGLLEGMAAAPEARLGELPMLREAERRQLLQDWQEPAPALPANPERTIPELFAEQLERAPHRVAVICEGESWTYAELAARAYRLAHRLIASGVRPGGRVALCLERSPDLVAAVLGVLCTGAAYVPIDPIHPLERRLFGLTDSGATVLVTAGAAAEEWGALPAGVRVVRLDREDLASESAEPPGLALSPDLPAYVIYTSGSTGRPKGVVVPHRNVARLFAAAACRFDFGAGDVWTLFHSYAFDFSVWEIWGALLHGGRLVVVPYWTSRSPAELGTLLRREGVTVLNQTPSAFLSWMAAEGAGEGLSLRWVIFGGEALEPATLAPWFERHGDERPRLVNMYGITETTVHVTWRLLRRADVGAASVIGRPLPGWRAHLLGKGCEPLPAGVPGEIWVGGGGLATAYLGQPERTAERFVPDPFATGGETGGRLYRSGDLARRRPDGELEYLGRIDRLVKIRGFRIELGEIEAALVRHPAVREAVVEARADRLGEPSLVAYLVPAGGWEVPGLAGMRSFLAAFLPAAMLPAAQLVLDALPLNANGKVDRKALPAPAEAPQTRDFAEPETELERFLAGLWCEALGIERAGLHDDFFASGGNSISGARLINRLQKRLGEIVHVVAIFDAPTVAALAAYLSREHAAAVARIFGGAGAASPAPEPAPATAGEAEIAELRRLVRPLPPARVLQRNPRAVFVLSPPRSGSTLLRIMLAGHPRLFAPPEMELLSFDTLAERRAAFSGRDAFWLEGLIRAVMEALGCTAEAASEAMAAWEAEGLSTLAAYGRLQAALGDRTLVDKTPSYTLDPSVLARIEEAVESPFYLHLVRHPSGMIRSFEEARLDQIFFRRGHSFSRRQLAELIWTVSHRNILESLAGVPAERQLRVRFEDLLADPVRVMSEICERLGLAFEPLMVQPYDGARRRMAEGPYAESRMLGDVKFRDHGRIDPSVAGRWRDSHPEDQLGAPARELAAILGYEAATGAPPEGVAGAQERHPLSFAQERLWFLDRLSPGSSAYNIAAALRLSGRLEAGILAAALTEISRRHDMLRTCFGEADGRLWQRVSPQAGGLPLPLVDLAALPAAGRDLEVHRLAAEETRLGFDLVRGPLLRVRLLRLAPAEHAALLTLHHIAGDGWSMGVLVREVGALYAAFAAGLPSPLPALPLQYADFARWQRRTLDASALEGQLAYWRQRLAGAPEEIGLPFDRPRPAVASGAGGEIAVRLPAEIVAALAGRGATAFMILLAGWEALLHRLSGSSDIVVGTPVANRNRAEIEGLIGFFVNTLVLRTDVAGGRLGFRELVDRVRETAVGAFGHQDLPFERLVEALAPERSLARTPLFQVLFALQNAPFGELALPGLTLAPLAAENRTAKFDLSLLLAETGDEIAGSLTFSRDLFEPATAGQWLRAYGSLLAAAAADPAAPLAELPLMSPAERDQLLAEWSDTPAPAAPLAGVHTLFARQAERSPEAVALRHGRESTTYRELACHAARLGRALRRFGVEPETVVGLLAGRSPEGVTGLLGVLASGGCLLPLEIELPAERLAFMLRDAGAVAVLTTRRDRAALPPSVDLPVLIVEDLLAAPDDSAGAPPAAPLEAAAYVLYTSGSTGRPKGVVVAQGSVVNYLLSIGHLLAGQGALALPAIARLGFDAFLKQILAPLLRGGEVWLPAAAAASDPDLLLAELGSREGTAFNGVPALWRTLLERVEAGQAPPPAGTLRFVLLGGDRVFPELVERTLAAFPQVVLWNSYGPTEATANATAGRLLAGEPVSLGRPIAGCRLAVLDPLTLQPLPASVPGELCLGGPGVARGYRRMPALTAERFIPDPFSPVPGGRLYRTGDRARLRPGGVLEFLGRLDDQVKLRGVRIEPGEVEAALAAHPGVAESAVATARVADGDALAAWIVPRAGAAPAAGELRDFLRLSLPEAMVPSFFTLVAALPRTASRKLDRRAVAALPLDAPAATVETAAPRGPVEEILAGIWQELFQRSSLGGDDFFALGGHSLLAVRLASRVRDAFGVELPLRAIFEHPSLAGLAAAVDELVRGATDEAPLARAPRHAAMPLSFPQRRLWILDRIAPGLATYNIPLPVLLEGGVDTVALAGVLDEILRRHEVLRTRFATDGEGEPCQVVEPAGPLALPRVDLRGLPAGEGQAELERLALEEATRPFALDRAPLLRAVLVDLAGSGTYGYALLLTLHHIAADGWSLEILLREAEALYAARVAGLPASLPELAIQYADYAVWQRRALQGDHLAGLLGYWRQRLAGLQPFELPADRPRPAVPSSRGGQVRLHLEPALAAALRELARRHRATLFMVTLSAFEALLWQLTGRAEGTIGSPSANRDRREIEPLIGFFVNMLVLRGEIAAEDRFPDLLARTRESALGAYAHRDLPFERLVEEMQPDRDSGRNPLFQIVFQLMPAVPRVPLGGLKPHRLELQRGTTQFDLGLSLIDGAQIEGALEYATDLYDRTTILRLGGRLSQLLAALAADPEAPLAALGRLSPAEAHQIAAEWNDTRREGSGGALVHRLFEQLAAGSAEAIALLHGEERVTYGELNRRANRLAHRLRREGVGAEEPVGVFLDRSPELVTAFLAVLKAGGAYVPLDPGQPEERLALLIAGAGIRRVLTSAQLHERLPTSRAESLLLAGDPLDGEPVDDLPPGPLSGASLAYVLFTSGSTGQPKGVAVVHEAIVRLARGGGFADLDAEQVFLQLAPPSFDASTLEIWGPLLNGGRLAIPAAGALSLEALGEAISRFGVTTLWLTSGLFRLMADHHLDGLRPVRQLLAGGDVLPLPQVARVLGELPECRLINGYGPTENTTFTTCHPVNRRDLGRGSIPIGRPVGGTQVHILDAGLSPVPAGSPGELYAGGLGLARGYFGQPDRTAERFVPHPDPRQPGERLYRTGDLARWLPDGAIEFLGRVDAQVKIRGFRIEPGEVEAALAAHPGVRSAVVGVRRDAEGDKRLVAWVVPEGREIGTAELRAHLGRRLPEFMVPAAFVTLGELPLNANGKVDRKALPEPAETADTRGGAPATPLEEVLAGLWMDLLGVPAVGTGDDFFALGGHSLLAIQLVSRVRETCGVEIPLLAVFDRPSLGEVAAEVEKALRQGEGREAPPIVPAAGDERAPLSFAQQRLWILDQMEPGLTAYNLPLAVRLDGRLQREALRRSLGEIVRRHEALRTGFEWLDGAPVQAVNPPEDLALPTVDLSALPAGRGMEEAQRLADAEAARPFSLEWDPLLRLALVALAAERHVLLLTLHHIVADGWSLGVLLRELAALYAAALAGRPSPLPELAVQYADYSLWQRRRFSGELLEREVAWWRHALDGAPVLELPTDRPHRSVHSFAGGSRAAALPRAMAEGLAALCRTARVTPFMALLGVWTALLARYSGQLDVVVGSPVANRDRLETEGLIGFFVNTLVMRVRLDGDPDVPELLGRVRETALGAFAHQEMPFQKLVEELQPQRSQQRSPFFQVFFTVQNAPAPPAGLPGLTLAALPAAGGTSKFELSLSLAGTADGWVASVEHNRDLFDPATAERMLSHFQALLAAFVANPACPLPELPLMSAAERQQLFREWNDTRWGDWRGALVHRVFERVAAAQPEATALLSAGRHVSYGELDRQANRLARALRRLGVGPEVAVGVYLDSCPELVLAYLAVLKAGGAYVPLNPAYPRERLEMMVEETAAPVVLTRDGLRASAPAPGATVLAVDGDEALWAGEDGSALADEAAGEAGEAGNSLAYVMYTSGSTGLPKGVAVAHEGIVRLARDAGFFTAGPGDVFLQITAVSFDVSTFEIWGALLNGARLAFLPSQAFSLEDVGQAVARYGVTVLFLTSGLFGLVVDRRLDDLRGVRQFVAGGDVVPVPQALRVVEELPGCRMINGYGPTENTTFTTWRTVSRADAGRPSIPIGGPVGNTCVHVLDAAMRPVPLGVRGELYTGGLGLARGYFRRPDLTAARFVPDPLAASPGERLYRTGDFARWLPDGGLEFLGRMDVQVKIRGFRIELGEVESTLSRHTAVAEAAVVAREDRPGDRRLVAYLVPAGAAPAVPVVPSVTELQAFLRTSLPDYMVPSAFVVLDRLPLTAAGKVDRAALPAAEDAARESRASYVPPRTRLERTIAEVWKDVLGIEQVGVHNSFFDLGGHSLLLLQAVSRLNEALGRELPRGFMFEHPTIAALARFLGDGGGEEAPAGSLEQSQERAAARRESIRQRRRGPARLAVPAGVDLEDDRAETEERD